MRNYCLRCEQNESEHVKHYLRTEMGIMACEAKYVRIIWKNGVRHEELRVFLPGYLFLQADLDEDGLKNIRRLAGVRNLLGSQENGFALIGADNAFAHFLLDQMGCIGKIRVYEKDGKLVPHPDAFGSIEAEIVKVKPREGIAQVKFTLFGQEMYLWLGYVLQGKETVEAVS